MAAQPRRRSVAVSVGSIKVGGSNPIVVQSMTNTDTADVAGTVAQVQTGGVAYLAHVGGFIFGAVAAHFFEKSRRVAFQSPRID